MIDDFVNVEKEGKGKLDEGLIKDKESWGKWGKNVKSEEMEKEEKEIMKELVMLERRIMRGMRKKLREWEERKKNEV